MTYIVTVKTVTTIDKKNTGNINKTPPPQAGYADERARFFGLPNLDIGTNRRQNVSEQQLGRKLRKLNLNLE